jgi:hypothetical protein
MQLLKRRVLQPQEAIIEKVYFKYNYKKYVGQYYPSKPNEVTLWAIQLRDGTAYYLGKFINGKLDAPAYNELSRHNDWSLLKGADRLYKFVEFGIKYPSL